LSGYGHKRAPQSRKHHDKHHDRHSFMAPPDSYEQRASECLELAATSGDFDERRTWRELAACWLRLSEHAARFRRNAKSMGAVTAEGSSPAYATRKQ